MGLIDDLLSLQIPKSVALSQDGQQVIYATTLQWNMTEGDLPKKSTLWHAETGKPGSSRPLTSGFSEDREPRWSSDNQTIAFISDRANPGEVSAIYTISLKGDEAIPLTEISNERAISKLEWSPDGRFIAFLSADEKSEERKAKDKVKDDVMVWGEDWAYDRLRIIDVASKTTTRVETGESHVSDFAWNDDGSEIAFIRLANPDIESPFLSGADIDFYSLEQKKTSHGVHFPTHASNLTWAEDKLYFIGPFISDFLVSANSVYVIDLEAGRTGLSYEHAAHGEEDCGFRLGKAERDVFVYVQSGMEDSVRMLNGRTLFARKQRIFSTDAAFTCDSDEVVLAVAIGDTNNPTEVYTTTASGGALVKLSDHGQAFADRQFGSCEFLSCQTLDDKETIEGMFLTPAVKEGKDGTPSKPLPTAVLIHGGPYYRITDSFDPMHFWIPVIMSLGYGILIPNYRGSSGRGQRFARYEPSGMGKYDEPDIVAMTQYAIERGWADKDKLVVGGWSGGGYLSYLSCVRNGMHGFGWKFKAAIPAAGVTDWDTMCLTSDVGYWQALSAGNFPWRMEKGDTSTRQGSALWEFKAAVEKGGIIPPMLILHGEKDPRVPLEQALGFRRALLHAKLPFEMAVYPREKHLFNEVKHNEDMIRRVERFVKTHLS